MHGHVYLAALPARRSRRRLDQARGQPLLDRNALVYDHPDAEGPPCALASATAFPLQDEAGVRACTVRAGDPRVPSRQLPRLSVNPLGPGVGGPLPYGRPSPPLAHAASHKPKYRTSVRVVSIAPSVVASLLRGVRVAEPPCWGIGAGQGHVSSALENR